MADDKEEFVFSKLWTRLLELEPSAFEAEMLRLFREHPEAMAAFTDWLEN